MRVLRGAALARRLVKSHARERDLAEGAEGVARVIVGELAARWLEDKVAAPPAVRGDARLCAALLVQPPLLHAGPAVGGGTQRLHPSLVLGARRPRHHEVETLRIHPLQHDRVLALR